MAIRTVFTLLVASMLTACARSAVMPLQADMIQVSTSAAPVCGPTGALKVALRQVAIETINRGYDSFIIIGARQGSQITGFTPVTATTVGNTFMLSGGHPLRRHNQGIVAKLFKAGDPAGAKAISARATLGKDWPKIVKQGTTTTC